MRVLFVLLLCVIAAVSESFADDLSTASFQPLTPADGDELVSSWGVTEYLAKDVSRTAYGVMTAQDDCGSPVYSPWFGTFSESMAALRDALPAFPEQMGSYAVIEADGQYYEFRRGSFGDALAYRLTDVQVYRPSEGRTVFRFKRAELWDEGAWVETGLNPFNLVIDRQAIEGEPTDFLWQTQVMDLAEAGRTAVYVRCAG